MKLREIVSNFLDSKDSSSHEFRRLYNLAVFGIKTEFNLSLTGKIKTQLLTLSANKTLQLPEDYIAFSKVGITNQQGEVVTLKVNNQLTNYHQQYFNNADRTEGVPMLPGFGDRGGINNGIVDYNDYYYLNYWYAGCTYTLFGIGSGTANIGEYAIDEQARIIRFDPYFQYSQVLLEYLSDCSDDEDDYEIDLRAVKAMTSYIRWQNAIDSIKKYNSGQIRTYKIEYYNEKRLAKMLINPAVLSEIQNAERRSWKLVPKA